VISHRIWFKVRSALTALGLNRYQSYEMVLVK